jgi:hypothetical protein
MKKDLKHIKQGVEFAKALVDSEDFMGATAVQQSVLEYLVAYLSGEDLNNQSKPDITLHFEEDFSNGETES